MTKVLAERVTDSNLPKDEFNLPKISQSHLPFSNQTPNAVWHQKQLPIVASAADLRRESARLVPKRYPNIGELGRYAAR